jgi:hypothetical protein
MQRAPTQAQTTPHATSNGYRIRFPKDSQLATIRGWNGKSYAMSVSIYEIISDETNWGCKIPGYNVGDKVRMISGVEESERLGHHPTRMWRTVCRIGAEHAEHVGFPVTALRLVNGGA